MAKWLKQLSGVSVGAELGFPRTHVYVWRCMYVYVYMDMLLGGHNGLPVILAKESRDKASSKQAG